MKSIKRVLSVIMLVTMLFTSLPLAGIYADDGTVKTTVTATPTNEQKEETSEAVTPDTTATADRVTGVVAPVDKKVITTATSTEIIYGTDGIITRAEWLHDLAVIFDMTVESDATPDNYFSDLSEDHEYYTDILLTVEFGVVDIVAGEAIYPDEPVTREFAASTLNFCLAYSLEEGREYTFSDSADCGDPASAQIALDRGWLELTDGAFGPLLYVNETEVKAMLDDAAAVLSATAVDENYTSTYEFAEDVVIVPDGTDASEDEDGVVSITDCPVTINEGDSFAVFYNSIPVTYTASAVVVEDNITYISTEVSEEDDSIVGADSQGVAYDMEFVPVDGMEMTLEEEADGLAKASGTKSIKKVNLKGSFEILSGVEASIKVSLKDPKIEYKVNGDYGYVALVSDAEITYDITANLTEAAGCDSLTIMTVNVGGIGSFDITVEFEISGSANGTVGGMLTAGVEYTKGVGMRAVKSFYQTEYSSNAEATAAVGLKASFGVTKLPFVKAYIYAEIGVKAKISATSWDIGTDTGTCVHFAAFLYGEYGVSASVKVGSWSASFNPKVEFFHEGNSPVRIVHHYENGVEVPSCTKGQTYGNYFTNAFSRRGGSGWYGAVGAYSLNADGTPFALYTYTLDSNNQATITKYNANYYTVNIPETIDGYTVVAIGSSAFASKNMVSVDMPDTTTTIGVNAFYNCTSLSNIIWSKHITIIDRNAFSSCDSLTEIIIPDSVTYLGNNVEWYHKSRVDKLTKK